MAAKLLTVLLAVLAFYPPRIAPAQNAPRTPALAGMDKRGSHAVGLKVVDQYDYSRSFRPATDELGRSYDGENARPIQTLIWYPARKTGDKPVVVGDYVHLIATEAAYEISDRLPAEASSRKDLSSILIDPMSAVRNAPLEPGRYPVVLYAPSLGGESWENAVLCEYLASYGYVVIASSSVGTHGRRNEGGVAGAETQARDVAFLLGYARTLPDTNPAEVAVAGYSFGGMASLFVAARDHRIKAQVAIDGTMRYAPDVIKAAGDVHPEQMTIPLLFFGGSQRPDPEGDLKGDLGTDNVLFAWKHGDVIATRMQHMNHQKFASIEHQSNLTENTVDPKEKEAITGWVWIERYTREFLNAHLKQDAVALAFLKRSAEENGIPPSVMTISFRAAQGTPPSLDGFRAELGRLGFEHASDIYKEMRTEDPDFKLEESLAINEWVYSLINSNHSAEAIHLLDAYKQACPDSREVLYLLGQAFEKSEQKQLAIDNYRKALQIEPDFKPAQEKMNALESYKYVSK